MLGLDGCNRHPGLFWRYFIEVINIQKWKEINNFKLFWFSQDRSDTVWIANIIFQVAKIYSKILVIKYTDFNSFQLLSFKSCFSFIYLFFNWVIVSVYLIFSFGIASEGKITFKIIFSTIRKMRTYWPNKLLIGELLASLLVSIGSRKIVKKPKG